MLQLFYQFAKNNTKITATIIATIIMLFFLIYFYETTISFIVCVIMVFIITLLMPDRVKDRRFKEGVRVRQPTVWTMFEKYRIIRKLITYIIISLLFIIYILFKTN